MARIRPSRRMWAVFCLRHRWQKKRILKTPVEKNLGCPAGPTAGASSSCEGGGVVVNRPCEVTVTSGRGAWAEGVVDQPQGDLMAWS